MDSQNIKRFKSFFYFNFPNFLNGFLLFGFESECLKRILVVEIVENGKRKKGKEIKDEKFWKRKNKKSEQF